MSKITINFFGESIQIKKPNNLLSLRNDISEILGLSPQDSKELILSYKIKGEKKYIVNEEDFDVFKKSKYSYIDIDISQNSKIYKDNNNKLKEEFLKDKKALEELLKKKNELEKQKTIKLNSAKQKLVEINSKINDLKVKGMEVKKNLFSERKDFESKINEINRKINGLEHKLNLPITNWDNKIFGINNKNKLKLSKSVNDNNDEVKSDTSKEMEIHNYIFCDGCKMNPIKGIRYNCKKCNIDYCEKCSKKYKVTKDHEHDYEVREKSVFQKVNMNKGHKNINCNPSMRLRDYPGKKLNGINPPPKVQSKKSEQSPSLGNNFKTDKIIHFGVKCDGCKMYPIIGYRFKCSICPKFDFCQSCMEKFSENHRHSFTKIKESK